MGLPCSGFQIRWRRSNLAFLNEPREEEGRPNKYVPQYQVAHIAKIAKIAG
ncbi:unnamed protein product [Arabis nemorensis]|uniref:Uncharacterized protein n=1 Tax=Arabis nemorensis TaxID=586526 RepID=A0A565AR44_9BRAS|nr:unnamed protein product [Arabis nemorensis]